MLTTHESLALLGGRPAIARPFRRFNSIGREEIDAVRAVLESGVLSKFLGCWDPDFFGGPKVREFEFAWAEYFGVRHAVTVNSATSGLIAAVGAIGIEPGDEVIVTPWTMSATPTAILHWNAIPVFADIDPRTFCIDPASVEANITEHTRAIIAVDIFGQSADMTTLMALAARHGLRVISDTAQAPGALCGGRPAGTLADVGCFSLNYHKHIHTGEGGVLVTNDDEIAQRLQLIRNHAEGVVEGMGMTDLRNMIGHNFRLGEMEAAVGIVQLARLAGIVADRQRAAERLTAGLIDLRGLQTAFVPPGSSHVYYVYPLVLDAQQIGVPRERIIAALEAEGVGGLSAGYQCLHLLPMYQRKLAYGSSGFPWTSDICRRDVSYHRGICPIAEELHESSFIGYELCQYELNDDDVDLVIAAFRKVWRQLDALA